MSALRCMRAQEYTVALVKKKKKKKIDRTMIVLAGNVLLEKFGSIPAGLFVLSFSNFKMLPSLAILAQPGPGHIDGSIAIVETLQLVLRPQFTIYSQRSDVCYSAHSCYLS